MQMKLRRCLLSDIDVHRCWHTAELPYYCDLYSLSRSIHHHPPLPQFDDFNQNRKLIIPFSFLRGRRIGDGSSNQIARSQSSRYYINLQSPSLTITDWDWWNWTNQFSPILFRCASNTEDEFDPDQSQESVSSSSSPRLLESKSQLVF